MDSQSLGTVARQMPASYVAVATRGAYHLSDVAVTNQGANVSGAQYGKRAIYPVDRDPIRGC